MGHPVRNDSCPYCDHANPVEAKVCQGCETSLAVSLAVTRPVSQDTAQALAALLSSGDLSLAQRIEERLIAGRGILIKEMDAEDARWCTEQAAQLGATLEIRRWRLLSSHRPRPMPRPVQPWSSRPSTGVLMVTLLALFTLGVGYLYQTITASPADAGIGWRSATITPGRVLPLGPEDDLADRPAAPVGDLPFSQEVLQRVQKAVVRINVADGIGTGFFVSRDGLVVTNYHVISRGGALRVTSGTKSALAQVVRWAPAWDLALLKVNLEAPEVLELADGAMALPTTPVFTVGSSEGLERSVRSGQISFIGRTVDAVSLLELDMAATQGNSGGPVVDYAGRVLGVVNATVADSERTSFAILSNYLFDGADALLRGAGRVYPLSDPFLQLQLKSLADVGVQVLERRVLTSSQAFVTQSGALALVAEADDGTAETQGETVQADLSIRTADGDVLLNRIVPAMTSSATAAGYPRDAHRSAVYLSFKLEPAVYQRLRQTRGAYVDVRVDSLRLRKVLELNP